MKRVLNYNEKKVQRGQASCILAGNFLKDLDRLNFYDKLRRFQDLISLNDRSKRSNTLHISLNFQPGEKLDKDTLTRIAEAYVEKIGFGNQPYLVYEHKDAGHPHIHIVTTNIQSSGKRIDTYKIGELKSKPACVEINAEFGLGKKQQSEHNRNEKTELGKPEIKRAITNALDQVINHYKYQSLASLNAILRTFNVMADSGKEGGRIQKYGGLLYHKLNENGKKIGVPIKASLIYSNPTLKTLQVKFKKAWPNKALDLKKLKAKIDAEISKNPGNLLELKRTLKDKGIDLILRENDMGFVYGVTFVDHNSKSVFNGSEIGKEYSAPALQKRFTQEPVSGEPVKKSTVLNVPSKPLLLTKKVRSDSLDINRATDSNIPSTGLLKELLKAEELYTATPYSLLPKRRKRKRKLNL